MFEHLDPLYPPSVPPDAYRRVVAKTTGARRRRQALVSLTAVAALAVVGVGLAGRQTSSPRSVVVSGAPNSPPMAIAPTAAASSRLLPPATSTISRLAAYQMPGATSDEQLYLGTEPTNPAELAITSVKASQRNLGKATLLSFADLAGAHTRRVGSLTVTLASGSPEALFAWWLEPDGTEVDLKAAHLTGAEFTAVVNNATKSSVSGHGPFLAGLPASLHFVRSAVSSQSGYIETLGYTQAGCTAALAVNSGIGDILHVGDTHLTTKSGSVALLSAEANNSTALTWSPLPGITAQLTAPTTSGPCTVTHLAQGIRSVTESQWEATLRQLGTTAQIVSSPAHDKSQPSVTAPPSTDPNQPIVTTAGPEGTTLRLNAVTAAGGICATLNISDPGLASDPRGGKGPYQAQQVCIKELPAAGPLRSSLWISPTNTRYFLVFGRATGASALSVTLHSNQVVTVPVTEGWWAIAIPYSDNAINRAVTVQADGQPSSSFVF